MHYSLGSVFRYFLIGVLLSQLMAGCGKSSAKNEVAPRFVAVTNSGIAFENRIQYSENFNVFRYRNFYNGGGVAIGDINNDSLPDLYFTANMGPNKLYLNRGNLQFEDITLSAGVADSLHWSTGVVMVDINNDGWLDIYVCNAGYDKGLAQNNSLFINQGDNTFTDSAAAYGLDDAGYTTHAAFFDYDLDGDLDCYMLNNSFIPVNSLNNSNRRDLRAADWPVADFLKGGGDKLLRNDKGRFTDVSAEAGIYGSLIGFGLGVTVGDVNNDGYPDIYISNDFYERDYLYLNQQNGRFQECLEKRMTHTSLSSMGADMGDINNDGHNDLFVTDMLPDDDVRLKTTSSFENYDIFKIKQGLGFHNQYMQNTLQVNDGEGQFTEAAHYAGVAASDWSWGGLMFDADNDGYNDLYVCNGIYQDVTDQDFIDFFANDLMQRMVLTGQKENLDSVTSRMPSNPIRNKMFRNLGNLSFEDVGENWGFTEKTFSNGAAYADLDRDGDLDLVVNNLNQPAMLYRNQTVEQQGASYIAFQLQQPAPNPNAIGARILVYAQGEILSREVIPSRGFQSSIDYTMHFGLGKRRIDSVTVLWPNLTCTRLGKPAINRVHYISRKGNEERYIFQKNTSAKPYIATTMAGIPPHREDEYVDFYYERNLPFMLSKRGPALAVGDVNGDGLEDVFAGGATGYAGMLLLQGPKGFSVMQQPAFNLFAGFEDVTAAFVDVDNDKDLDLLVGSGGNHQPAESAEMQNRLYLNDGKGTFAYAAGYLPANSGNTSCIAAADFDGDGDQDLFIGNHSIPLNYGQTPPQYLLRNNGKGQFEDITRQQAPELLQAGLVTAATWADTDGNGKPELLLAGEWMNPQCYTWENGRLRRKPWALDDHKGWWQSLTAGDLNGDGYADLLLGNIGLNFYLKASPDAPLRLWAADFDQNGLFDKIITRVVNEREVPVFLKREITDQLPVLKKQNLRHADYAQKTITTLLTDAQRKDVKPREITQLASLVAFGDGKGGWVIDTLPVALQLSCINAASWRKTADGNTHLLVVGNQHALLPQFARLDGNRGQVWELPKGSRTWKQVQSSLGLPKDLVINRVALLNLKQQPNLWLTAANHDSLRVIAPTKPR